AGSQNCNVFNGYASSRCDYLTSIGTVSFAANETSKTLSIPIIDDSYFEGNEFFTITLSNSSGATLGTTSTTTVTITDNDSATAAEHQFSVALINLSCPLFGSASFCLIRSRSAREL